MELVIGIILGAATVVLAKVVGFSKDRSFYPLLLIVIALYYVLFAFQSFGTGEILFEAMVSLAFIALAFLGHKKSLLLVVAGLILHGFYDLLQTQIPYSTQTPDWWPLFCLGFDVTLALGLVTTTSSKKIVKKNRQ